MAQLRAWWRNVSDEATAPFDALAKADVLRHRRQTTVADVVHEMVSHLAGEPLIPRAPKNGHLFPEPDDFRSSSATGTSSNSSTSDSSSMAVSQPLDNVPVAVASVIYPSLSVASAPADVACKLFDVLERCCDCALEDPGCNPAPSPASDGLWYSVTVSRFGPLGVSINDGRFPGRGYGPESWIPLIESCAKDGASYEAGIRAAPGGIRSGDVMTHIGGVSLLGLKMEATIQTIIGFASQRPLRLTFFRHAQQLVGEFKDAEINAAAASRNNQWQVSTRRRNFCFYPFRPLLCSPQYCQL